VGHDLATTVTNDETRKVQNNQTLNVTKDRKLDVGGNETIAVTGDQKVTVSKTIVMEATTSIELKVGGSSIKIEPAKVTIKSPEIAVQADGMMAVKAGGVLTIEGAMVKIN
jgi:type VI secretion system secreted protein VgrG